MVDIPALSISPIVFGLQDAPVAGGDGDSLDEAHRHRLVLVFDHRVCVLAHDDPLPLFDSCRLDDRQGTG